MPATQAFKRCALGMAIILGGLIGSGVQAAIAGFGDGSAYTLNGRDQDDFGNILNTTDAATISSGVLHITSDTTAQARSAFYNTPQDVNSFVATFTYQNINTPSSALGAADGFAFVVQNQGLTALGGSSAGLGYTINDAPQPPSGPGIVAISPSAGVQFYLRNGNGATEFGTNGSGTFGGAASTNPVDLTTGNPIRVTLIYDAAASTLTESLLDTVTLDPYSASYSADIVGAVGTTALVGFTGATGGAFSDQQISNFTFTSGLPEPTLTLPLAALVAGMRRKRPRQVSR